MSVLVLGSAKAAPGATTTALALAATWPADRHVLVVEADADGGVLAVRQQLSTEPGLSTLAVAGRRSLSADALDAHLQRPVSSDVQFLVAPPAAEQARRALELIAGPLGRVLVGLPDTDTIIDVGRLRPDLEANPLLHTADAVLVVARPRLEELQQLPARLRALRPNLAHTGLLLVGDRPYPPAEVAAALDTEVVAVIADDQRAARALTGGGRTSHLRRSPLLRSAREAGETVRSWLDAHGEPGDDPLSADRVTSSRGTSDVEHVR